MEKRSLKPYNDNLWINLGIEMESNARHIYNYE